MQKRGTIKNVIIYCRESRDDGYQNFERIETQRDILVDFCNKNKLGNIIDIVLDDNLSGTNFKRLDPIKEMIRRGDIDVFVCKDASRIGRNLLDSLRFIEFLDDNKVELIFESEQYNEDMFPLIAWFNERRVKDDSTKIRRVLKHKMENGDMVISAPYGYIKDGNTLKLHPEASKVVKEIFGLYADGLGCYSIAAILNKKNYPTPSQLKSQYTNQNFTSIWNKQHVDRIIKHVAYSGDMPYGMREKVSYKSKKYIRKDKEDWIIIENHHEPIVDRDIYNKVQQRIKTCKKYEVYIKDKRPFAGLVFCGRCGSKIYSKTKKGRRTSMVCFKSNCEGAIKDHVRENYGCNPHRVYEDDLIKIVESYLESYVTDTDFKKELFSELGDRKQKKSAIQNDIKRIEKRIDDFKNKASKIYDDKLDGVLPEFIFKQKIDEITKNIDNSEKDLQELYQFLETLSDEKEDCYSIDTIVEAIHKNGITNENLALLFKKIIIFEPNDITEKYREEYNISDETFLRIAQNGGILFVQNFQYDCKFFADKNVLETLDNTSFDDGALKTCVAKSYDTQVGAN